MINQLDRLETRRVLFVSVHPDDETLGCGGTILKHKRQGDRIYWLNITGVQTDHPFGFSEEFVQARNALLGEISAAYGIDSFTNLDLPTMMLDTIPLSDFVRRVDTVILDIKPNIIYLPNRSDVHSDHRVAFDAVYACTKNFRKPYIRKIMMYETLSETEFAPALAENAFIPNSFVDISKFMERKLEIMQMYDTEIMPDPFPRSIYAIKGLAAYRGSRIGVEYAEAFMILLDICK